MLHPMKRNRRKLKARAERWREVQTRSMLSPTLRSVADYGVLVRLLYGPTNIITGRPFDGR